MTSVPTSPQALTQQNAFWDSVTRSVYFSDTLIQNLYRYSLDDDKMYSFTVAGLTLPSVIVPISGSCDQYFIGANGSAYIVEWDGQSSTGNIKRPLFSVTQNTIVMAVAATPTGELYLGTYSINHCTTDSNKSLYKYSAEDGLIEIANHYRSTNGIAIIGNTLYQLDGCERTLSAFDRNPCSGDLSECLTSSPIWTFTKLIWKYWKWKYFTIHRQWKDYSQAIAFWERLPGGIDRWCPRQFIHRRLRWIGSIQNWSKVSGLFYPWSSSVE